MDDSTLNYPASPQARFLDTHCHLDAPGLIERLSDVLKAAERAGIADFLVPGVHPDAWPGIAALSREHGGVHPAFGVHPMHAASVNDAVLAELERLAPAATAIGEIGLDYILPAVPREVQQQAFRAQLRIARRFRLPVLLHCRKAFGDLLRIISEEGEGTLSGVMHAFSGSPEVARDCVKLGLYISIGGTVTFSNAVKPLAVAAQVPADRLLLETDAPDLTPEPHRGEMNEPAFLVHTAEKVAAVRGMTFKEVAEVTWANSIRLFRL